MFLSLSWQGVRLQEFWLLCTQHWHNITKWVDVTPRSAFLCTSHSNYIGVNNLSENILTRIKTSTSLRKMSDDLYLQDWYRDEAQAGRRTVWWCVRGHLEEIQPDHRSQDSPGKISIVLVSPAFILTSWLWHLLPTNSCKTNFLHFYVSLLWPSLCRVWSR